MTTETGMLVQKLRLRRGWSQEDLAELCALSVRTIQRVERGHAASAESLKAIASVFEIDLPSLMEPEMDRSNMAGVSREEALALAHVRRIKSFYHHFMQFAAIVGALAVMNYITNPHDPWIAWVALPWGAVLAVDGLRAFGRLPFLTAAWERRQVEKYMVRGL